MKVIARAYILNTLSFACLSMNWELLLSSFQVCQELERQAGRAKLVAAHDGLDLEYLKNIMLKLYETGVLLSYLQSSVC